MRIVCFLCVALGLIAHARADDSEDYPGLESRSEGVRNDGVILITSDKDDLKHFTLGTHQRLSEMKDPSCTAWIDRGHWMHDVLLQTDSPLHFDNCNFEDGAKFVQGMKEEILRQGPLAVRDPAARRSTLIALGRALHTIQDFYAHSTYVEVMDSQGDARSNLTKGLPVIDIWTDAGRKELVELQARREEPLLISGVWAIGWPKRCTGVESHGDLNKDSPKSKSGSKALRHQSWGDNRFQAAFNVAERATMQFIRDVLPAQLVSACGGTMAALVLNDTRDPK